MTINENKIGIISKLLLFTATLIWGSSFFILKNTLDELPTFFLLSVRFLAAAVLLGLIFAKRFKRFNLKHLRTGLVTGLSLGIAYATQTVGLDHTTPGINAFLTATYCVLVPFMMWGVTKKAPDKFNLIAAVLCLTGIGLVCVGTGASGFGIGEVLTLVSGVFFALQMVAVAVWGDDLDLIVFTVIQFFTAFLVNLVCFFAFGEKIPESISFGSVLSLAYLAVMCTILCFLFMNFGIKHTSASYSSLVLSLESVFGVLFSIIFYPDEHITPQIGCGFAVIFVSMVINETKLSFLRKHKE